MRPDDVETIAMPRPPSTRGISVLRAYTRRPGRLMRRRPDTAGVLPPMYFIFRTISRGDGWSYVSMKPSFFRIFAISSFVRLGGTETFSCRARAALRTRVSMSATGSFGVPGPLGCGLRTGFFTSAGRASVGTTPCGWVVVSSVISFNLSRQSRSSLVHSSPTRLRHARQLADERSLAEADPAETEPAHVPARPAADLAAVVGLHLVLVRPSGLQDETLLRHA